jgi:hypothetical protein
MYSRNLLAQEIPDTTTIESVLLLQQNQLNRLDITTGARQSVASVSAFVEDFSAMNADRRIWSAGIDKSSRFLYLIEAYGSSSNRQILGLPTASELVEVDLQTNQRRVLSSKTTVFNFIVSADRQHMIILYYESEYLFSRQKACILDLVSLICQELNVEAVGSTAFWIDNQQFVIYFASSGELTRVNIDTLSTNPISISSEWFINWATPIPNTRDLLITAKKLPYNYEPSGFLRYNLDTEMATELPFTSLGFEDFPNIGSFDFSPDGHFLLYSGDASALIDFSTGELIQRFEVVVNAGWMSNEILLVQGSVDGASLNIISIDAANRQASLILSGDAAGGILLIPDQ